MNRSYVTVFLVAWMLAVAINSAVAQDRVQAGTLVCNTSMEFGVIVGSREALNCTFTPSVPGPIQSYNGTITKLGLDLGATARGVIVWLVYAPTTLRTGELAGSYVGATGEALAWDLVPMFWSAARTGRSPFNLFQFKGRLA
jgi:hypothetical protein